MFTGLVHLVLKWRKYHQSLGELSALNDRDLRDIGISRSDIDAIAWRSADAK